MPLSWDSCVDSTSKGIGMEQYIFVMAVLYGIGILCHAIILASGRTTKTTPGTRAIDLVLSVAMFVWAISLLTRG